MHSTDELFQQRTVFEAITPSTLCCQRIFQHSKVTYQYHNREQLPDTAVQLASRLHLQSDKITNEMDWLHSSEVYELVKRDRGYHRDLPCSSSLEEPELPSSHELLLFPFEVKLLVGLFTEFLPLLLPDISAVPFSNIAGILTAKRKRAWRNLGSLAARYS